MGSKSKANDAEAARISNAIDEELRIEREARKKKSNREVKVMLLGQAESGKSTLQKQMQLYYASQTLDREKPSWKPIVYFNILKALRMIIEELDTQYPAITQSPTSTPGSFAPSPTIPPSTASSVGNVFSFTPASISNSSHSSNYSHHPEASWFPELQYLRNKILPLVASEEALASELSGGITLSGGRSGVYVRAGWQALVTQNRAWPLPDIRAASTARPTVVSNIVAKTLLATQHEIMELWRHPAVLHLLRANKLYLEESAAFFLDHIYRISEPEYIPSIDDVLHVRVQTLGVTEHQFDFALGGIQYHWLLYDVGGARQAWVPFFDDATAIIFLAPISAFDQYLEEDPRTNRIDDSLQLFTNICTNKLLSKTALILMLNKTDLLKQKLQAGIKVRKYISSYGDRPNNYEEVSEYFRAHFIQIQKRKDTSNRSLYIHFTSMLDVKATQSIIVNVGEAIMRQHLSGVGLA
ncbi:G-protein alpha subunit [Cristinia sonorae]|uniref:G-protein alpha subunit n=1 Tax=Cristinia sonorae TaxID=1940300 RepID=A0A8K0UZ87_9AGAR|nr:G-protein alpha subunit [Cristinia sonorae]